MTVFGANVFTRRLFFTAVPLFLTHCCDLAIMTAP